MSTPILTLIILFSSIFFLQAQDLTADTIQAQKLLTDLPEKRTEAYEQLQEAAKIYKKHQLLDLYYLSSLKAAKNAPVEDYETMIATRLKLVTEIAKEQGNNPKLLKAAYLFMAGTYSSSGNFAKAIDYYKLTEEVLLAQSPQSHSQLTELYISMSTTYASLGDGQRFGSYITEAEKQSLQITTSKYLFAKVLHIKSHYLAGRADALKWINEAIELVQKEFGAASPKLFDFIKTKSSVYHIQKESGIALEILEDLLARKIKHYGSNNLEIANAYIDLGAMHKDFVLDKLPKEERKAARKKKRHIAIDYHLKAAKFYDQFAISKGLELNTCTLYRNLGNLYREDGQYNKALGAFHRSVKILLPNETSTDSLNVIKIANTNKLCLDLFSALRTMADKVFALHYLEPEIQGNASTELLMEMDAIMDQYALGVSDDALGYIYALRNQYVTGPALQLYIMYMAKRSILTQDRLNFMHRLIEKNKNAQLLSTLKSSNAAKLGNIDPQILAEEKAIKTSISKTKKKLLDAANNKDSLAILDYQEKLIALQTEYEEFSQKLKKIAPKYHELKYENQIPNLKEIQAQLDENTAILEFQRTPVAVTIFQIFKDTVIYLQARHIYDIDPWVKKMRHALTSISMVKNSPETIYREYIYNAQKLAHALRFDSFFDKHPDINNLVIIPSGELNYIPFEALLYSLPQDSSDMTNYRNLDYLIKHSKISYAYSTSLWAQNMQHQSKGNKGILGFAASYDPAKKPKSNANTPKHQQDLRGMLIDLPGARKEVNYLQELYAGDFYIGKDANEEQFKKIDRNQYNIVHLAMHGLLNKEHSFASSLAFTENSGNAEDDFVFAYELTQMPIETDLVVLSACETGYGKFRHGEGVASLARSFMYAGTPSLIMTLWEVNDHSTAEIMKLFYEGLHNGLDKPAALQAAKLKYLERSKGIASHPFFWSPFVNLGNTNPVNLHSKNYAFYWNLGIGIGAALLLLIGYFIFRAKRKKTELS